MWVYVSGLHFRYTVVSVNIYIYIFGVSQGILESISF